MNKQRKGRLIRFIACVAVIGILIGFGALTDLFRFEELKEIKVDFRTRLKVIVMSLGVIACEALITLLLDLLHPKSHRAQSVLSITSSLMKYVAGIVIICWGLSIIGVNVATIVASVGIIALIVGFSAESLIADVVTGAFMLFENQYNVGDIVEVDGFRGTVTNIGIRTTSITDLGGNVKIVNNSDMKNILNRSDKSSICMCDIAIPYSTDLIKLEAEIPALADKIYNAHRDMLHCPPKYVGVQALAESSVVLRFIAEVDECNIYAGARLLNHDILLGFRGVGVECPFPQMDVHQK
ncbi:MAG: mechanosensitive ion channel [Clostridia bacterium]|nr:mechanosensitive ion channel [Clostridia bacterium]